MNDQQLETVLRRSLSQHAGTVDSGPVWAPDAEELDQHPGRRPIAWWPIAAAIIAVLAVVGIVVAIRHATSDRRHPDSPVVVTRSACTTNLPPVWQNAIVVGTHTGQNLLGGGPNGEVVVQRHVGTQLVTALIGADGSTRTILELPFDGPYKTGNAVIDRQWILLPIIKWTTTPQTISRFDLVDRATLEVVQEIPIGKNPATSAPVLFQNHVYWVQQGGPRGGGGSVIDYDVAQRTRRTLAAGTVQDLIGSPLGVAWQDAAGGTHLVAGSAPDRVPGLRGTHPQLVSNGHDYAWPSGTGIVWYSDATKQTIVVQRVVPDGGRIDVAAVAGPFVLVGVDFGTSSSTRIIDTRTGTAAIVDTTGGAAAGGDILAYTAPDTVVLHTDRLPALTC